MQGTVQGQRTEAQGLTGNGSVAVGDLAALLVACAVAVLQAGSEHTAGGGTDAVQLEWDPWDL